MISFYKFWVTHPTFQVQLTEIFPGFEDKNQPTSKGEPPGFINPLGFEDLLKPPNWAALAMLARSEKKWSNLRLNPPTRVGWTPVHSRYYHLTSKVWVYHLWQKEVWTETIRNLSFGARHSCTPQELAVETVQCLLGKIVVSLRYSNMLPSHKSSHNLKFTLLRPRFKSCDALGVRL